MANELVIQMDPNDERALNQFMQQVAAGVSDLTPFFDAVEMYMIDSLTQNFEAGGRPQAWQPLSDVTVELKGSDAILQDLGDLKQSVNAGNTERDALSLKIWAGDEKAAFHQFIDEDPLKQFGMVNANGMPMRPFMLFQAGDLVEIESILIKYIDDVLNGGI